MAAETFRITEELTVEDKTGPGLSSAQRKVSQFDKTIQETQSRLTKLTGSRWDMTVNAVDKATRIISTVESKMHSAVGKAWNFTVGVIDKATAPLQGIFNLLKNPILQAGAVLGITVSVSDAISTFGGFESTMSKVQAISHASESDMEALTALAKEMGATTKFTAEEAAQGLTYMAMAGWKTGDMLTSLSGIMDLAAASGEDLATVSDIVTDAMTAFGLAADGVTANGVSNATHFADVLAAASSGANTTVSGMGETFKYVGSMAGALQYSIEDVALATGLMANQGIKGTMAGTALNSMLTRLSTNTSGAADAISALGVEFYNADGSARNLGDVMGELRKATAGMTAAQKSELANTVAGMEAQKGLLAILNTSEEDYNTLADAIYNADGAAKEMSETMLDNMQGSLTLLQSAADGAKLSLGSRLSPYVRQFADWLTTKMPAVENVINDVMDTVDAKVEALKATIADFTSSEEWANTDVWGKISIAWDKIVAEPFSAWWDSSGKPWLTEKVSGFGETLGSGITAGLLAILGFDASDAVEDGKSIGASFIEGFKDGFDTEKISEALTEWASDHKGIVAAAGVIAGGKLLGGISRAFQGGKGLVNSIGGLFGKGSSGSSGAGNILETYTTSTMSVTAGTVIVNGSSISNAARNVVERVAGGGTAALSSAGGALGLPGAGGGQLALPGGGGLPSLPGGTAAAGGLTSAGSWLSKLLTVGSKSSFIGADGTLLAVQGGIGGTLGSVGGALGSGATTAAGAAAAGGAAIGGGLLGGAGIISGLIDIFKGTRTSGKDARDKYATGGTKIGMVGAGAAAGAAIGSVVPVPVVGTGVGALVGAGIGGIGALIGGNKAGKAISDSTDEGGAINTVWQNLKAGAGDAWETVKSGAASAGSFVSEKWDAIKEGAASIGAAVSEKWNQASTVISEKWDTLSGWFDENVWTPISDVGISAVNIAAGVWLSISEPIKEKFGELSAWFGENVWTPVKEGAQAAGEWVSDKWTEAKAWASETWQTFSGWFEESVWTPVKEGAQAAGEWVGDKWTEAKDALQTAWEGISGWFGENVWEPIKSAASNAWSFVKEKWEGAKSWVASLGDKGSEVTGLTTSQGESTVLAHASGGIMTQPHMGLVAEDGPEAIVPLGSADRSRGLAVWEQAGDILGVNNPNPVGSNDDGRGDFPAGEPDNSPEGGGDGSPVPVYPTTAGGGTGPREAPQDTPINVPVNIALNPEIIIQATAGMSADDIVQALKEHIRELVDDISDEMAEKLARIFANMPVKGGA